MTTNQEIIDLFPQTDQKWVLITLIPLIESVMSAYQDVSHDMHHVWRVTHRAVELARLEWTKQTDKELSLETSLDRFLMMTALIALCHDVGDHKYEDSEHLKKLVSDKLETKFGQQTTQLIFDIGSHVSWSKEQRDIRQFGSAWRYPNPVEQKWLECVQDADRLDALGTVGFVRCVAYGAKQGNDFTHVVSHWHDKLKHLHKYMKTILGKQLAKGKTAELACQITQLTNGLGLPYQTY